ncbi:MAG: hypothetical protein ACRD9L_20580, partial [Bryobacteraceae bacterium]
MSPEHDAASLQRGRFHYFPVVPGRMEFSAALRSLILETRPQIVAVELPGMLEAAYLRAVSRLPEMSVVLYPDDKEEDRAVYVPVEPTDPFTEAVRSAREIGAAVLFLEPDVSDRPHLPDTYPDTYSIRRIGLEKYIEAYRIYPAARSEEVLEHASGVAWKLQGADPLAHVLVVVSLNLLDPILDAMEAPQEPPQTRAKDFDVRVLNPHPDCLAEITVEYPFLQDRYEFYRIDATDEELIERPRAQFELLREAEKKYRHSTGESVQH